MSCSSSSCLRVRVLDLGCLLSWVLQALSLFFLSFSFFLFLSLSFSFFLFLSLSFSFFLFLSLSFSFFLFLSLSFSFFLFLSLSFFLFLCFFPGLLFILEGLPPLMTPQPSNRRILLLEAFCPNTPNPKLSTVWSLVVTERWWDAVPGAGGDIADILRVL